MQTRVIRYLKALVWILAALMVCHVLAHCGGCASRDRDPPAKQQKTHNITRVFAPSDSSEPSDRLNTQVNTPANTDITTNTTTSIWIFACVGVATLLSCIICVWAARVTPGKSGKNGASVAEPAAPAGSKSERLRRSNHK